MSRPLPKHVEIAESLIRRIRAGVISDGARLPTEREMAAAQGVAVGTLRKALAILEGQGLLDRVQGSGNYVRHHPGARSVYGLFRLERPEGGGLPTADVLSLDRLPRSLPVPPGDDATRIRRLRRLDGDPVAVEEIWYLGPGSPQRDDLSDSLYLTWLDHFGQKVDRIEDRIGLSPFPEWTPEGLPWAAGHLAGHAERWTWGPEGQLFEFSWTWFHSAAARFVTREGGERWQSRSDTA